MMLDRKAKTKALVMLATDISKKFPKSMKSYLETFKGTGVTNLDEGEKDDDLVNNIKKSYKKKSSL